MSRKAPAKPKIKIEFGQASHPGMAPDKQINEDSCGYADTPFGHLFVVCDGMGGHAGGQQASDIAVRTIFDIACRQDPDDNARSMLRAAIEEAARKVFKFGGDSSTRHRPGSTCVSMLLRDGHAETAHVGDSRAYLIRNHKLRQLTRDHSVVQGLVERGIVAAEDAINHPDANRITRALGMQEAVDVELIEEPIQVRGGDIFVLASDGLTDLVDGDDLRATTAGAIDSGDAQGACDVLVTLANNRGGHDNITVQVVRIVSTGVARTQVGTPHDEALRREPPNAPTVAQSPAVAPKASGTILQEPQLESEPSPPDYSRPVILTNVGTTIDGLSEPTVAEEPYIPTASGATEDGDDIPVTIPPTDLDLTPPLSAAQPHSTRAAGPPSGKVDVALTKPDNGVAPTQAPAPTTHPQGPATQGPPTKEQGPATHPQGPATQPPPTKEQGAPTKAQGPAVADAPAHVGSDNDSASSPAKVEVSTSPAQAALAPPEAAGPASQSYPQHQGYGPGPPSYQDGTQLPSSRMLYLMLGMAVTIGMLIMLLIWALFLRE